MKTKLLFILSLTLTIHAYAGSATWNLNPISSDWNDPLNWTPNTVPNGPDDVATFDVSNTTNITLTGTRRADTVDHITFTAAASSYTFTLGPTLDSRLILGGGGIINESGETQNFVTSTNFCNFINIEFRNGATAGDGTVFTNTDCGEEAFYDNSNAGTATFINQSNGGFVSFADDSSAGSGMFINEGVGTIFGDNSTAGNGTFVVEGDGSFVSFGGFSTAGTGTFSVSDLGEISFNTASSADHGTFIVEGGANAGDSSITANGAAVTGDIAEGILTFEGFEPTTAANATIVATGGSNGANGGLVRFFNNTQGGTCRIELLGNSQLDLDRQRRSDLTIGSLEGQGTVLLGSHALIIGSNNLSTTFSGLIQDSHRGGALAKIGTGTSTLSGANTYTGGTTISSGILLVSNSTGSGTGTGAVSVNGGTLGGSGIITGAVTVGTNTGVQAFLAPSKGVKKPATLTIQSPITLNDDSTYIYKLDTKRPASDEVIAHGVTIDNGAKFSFRPSGDNALTLGQVFTIISNISATPIAGSFHNLPEGKILTVNGSNLQASYSGGDGNDLTLTVVP